jgi:hypothetical protein
MAASEAEFADDGGGRTPRLRSAVDEPGMAASAARRSASLTRPDWQRPGLSQRLRAMGPATAPEMVLAAKSFCLTRPAAISALIEAARITAESSKAISATVASAGVGVWSRLQCRAT